MNDTGHISRHAKLRAFKKIIESEEFCKGKKYKELLEYLVNCSLKEEVLKESTLAMDFFDKDTTFDPAQDSSVRAYVSNLRKKIEHYYLTEGINDETWLSIPKGHYYVEFLKNENIQKNNKSTNKNTPRLPYILLGLIAITVILYVFIYELINNNIQNKPDVVEQQNHLWQEWFQSTKDVLIVLGNYYFFGMSYDNEMYLYMRSQYINSDKDLTTFLEENPSYKEQFEIADLTYFDRHIPYCLAYVIKSFIHYNKDYKIKLSSDVTQEDIRTNNIIYIGPYKCLGLLESITTNLHFEYVQNSVALRFLKEDSTNMLTFSFKDRDKRFRTDHAVVAKVAGAYNNEYILFVSYYDFGNLSTARQFTHQDSLRILNKHIRDKYFEALFAVEGVVPLMMDLNIKLLHYNPLEPEFKIGID